MKNSYVKSFNHWALNEAEEAEGSLLLNLKSGSGSNLETGKPLQDGYETEVDLKDLGVDVLLDLYKNLRG